MLFEFGFLLYLILPLPFLHLAPRFYNPSSAACVLTLPPYLQICSTMVFTDIISDVLALLTPTIIHTCTRTHAHVPHTSTFIHANPRSPPHTRKRTPTYFPFYLLAPPYIPVHAHPSTSTHTHLQAHTHFPFLIFTLGLLFHSDFSFLTRLCPLYEPGVLGHSLPTGLVIQPLS